jgi:diadenosine tetraphosphate (Ap4A) HIT family hydrolase
MSETVFSNSLIRVEIEEFEIPWIKIFTQEKIKEFSSCSKELQLEILDLINIIEKEMINYFNPAKINISSFGNYVPHVHFHIQARFEKDSYFPEPTWGKKQRDSLLVLPSLEEFLNSLKIKLNKRIYK